ncbi:MAG: hypothetical protein LBR30_05850 [Clostridioides sp.]|jgi:hypothetical protein|nr:hypothetical protein [Clostridioides sp.]
MSLNLDAGILSCFDYFFENDVSTFDKYDFIAKLHILNIAGKKGIGISLQKKNSDYWRLYFELPREYFLKLKRNVHPIFNEYIYDSVSIYNNEKVYNFLNENIVNIFNSICIYEYNFFVDSYLLDFKSSFLNKVAYLRVGEVIQIARDLYMIADSNESFDFFNGDKSFVLNLKYDSNNDENILDSLLDLRKSILINKI